MKSNSRLWRWLGLICVLSFGALGYLGWQIYLSAPPIPKTVVTTEGEVLFTGEQVQYGQQAWRSAGGQQLGSVWGHGGYVAPDWSADWLHREATALQGILAAQRGQAGALTAADKAAVDASVREDMRRNTYDDNTGAVTVSLDRARAIREVANHYEGLFGTEPSLAKLREQYAMTEGALPGKVERQALAAFFFWSSWAAVTNRPGETDLSYTSNWPHEPLVGNTMSTSAAMWSMVSVILLLAGIAAMLWLHGSEKHEEEARPPKADPLLGAKATPSMKATRKYFFTVIGLMLLQIAMGVVTAHYAVEGDAFFGFPLAEVLPYVTSRTIHTQVGIFWIATAWLATGLYVAPLLSGREPKLQKLGVDALFWALIVVVLGSTITGWLGTLQHRGVDFSFWLGNQGLEFTSMGRVWQLLLFAGLLFWVFLLGRALWPALRRPSETRGLIAMVFLSASCLGGFYATSLTWGQHTHYAMVEYWRWWLVHLWVEGFFEVFATAVVAFLFTRLGLIPVKLATVAVLFATIIFMAGGVLGTLHHLYFSGTSMAVMALGASFSALEVVPLAYIGFEAYEHWKLSSATPWMARYKWPVMFFLAVSFWNLVGAGLFGFLINPPLSLYYMQGLNLTPLHGHTALFGVYGMLGIGLVLFCLRGMMPELVWDERILKGSFWCFNVGLAMMALFTLLPLGTLQLIAAIDQGYWYARSAEFMQQPIVELLVWMRVPGDTIFAIGSLLLTWFIASLWLRPRREPHEVKTAGEEKEETDRARAA